MKPKNHKQTKRKMHLFTIQSSMTGRGFFEAPKSPENENTKPQGVDLWTIQQKHPQFWSLRTWVLIKPTIKIHETKNQGLSQHLPTNQLHQRLRTTPRRILRRVHHSWHVPWRQRRGLHHRRSPWPGTANRNEQRLVLGGCSEGWLIPYTIHKDEMRRWSISIYYKHIHMKFGWFLMVLSVGWCDFFQPLLFCRCFLVYKMLPHSQKKVLIWFVCFSWVFVAQPFHPWDLSLPRYIIYIYIYIICFCLHLGWFFVVYTINHAWNFSPANPTTIFARIIFCCIDLSLLP